MPVREILELGNPLLHQPCREVADPAEVRALIRDLDDTLADFRSRRGFGRGISAPQIGELARVIFVRVPSLSVGPLINPRIEWARDERFELWDDCFSFPDLMVRVSRALQIRVGYSDERGGRKTLAASGDLSELLQHEIDHLDGILAPERAISGRAFCTRAEWERRHAGRPAIASSDPVSV
jgi:peptide deformylase